MKLTIELVPNTSWYTNVRSNVSKKVWGTIKKQVYKNANYKCQICGGRGRKHPVECHEIWCYDDNKKIQILKRLIALCPKCHEVKHIGLAKVNGRFDTTLKHFCKINNMSKYEANLYIDKVFSIWAQRSLYKWKLGISLLYFYIK